MVLVGVATILEFLQRPAFRYQLDHLELEQKDTTVEQCGHVDSAMVGHILQTDIQAQSREVAVEHAGVIVLVLGNWVVAIPVVRNSGEEDGEQIMQAGEVVSLQQPK